ncbi:MAG: lytic murein transglycosylase B [Candidatus Accumulibacter sp.]|jgi:lytic murein transglycosylase B|nr:lytic murein transglycosylase B [Accumulibacter sp.]
MDRLLPRNRLTRFFSPPASAPLASLHDEFPWILTAIVATAAPHAIHLPAWITFLCAVILIWNAWLWKNKTPCRPALPAFFALSGIAGILMEYRTLFGRDPGVALLFLLIALKPLEMRGRRDSIFIIMLGFFLLLTHYFYSQNIFTGLWLLVAIWLLVATLLRLYGGKQPLRRIFSYAGILFAQAFPFMLILFLLFPRVQGPLWGLPKDARAGLTGLSDTLAPGSLDDLIQSGEIAFRVKFQDDDIPEKSSLYWRGPVFTDYDGKMWRARPFFLLGRGKAPSADGHKIYRYVTTLEPHNQRWILPLDMPVSAPENSILTSAFETVVRERVGMRAQYHFDSIVDYTINVREDPLILREALHLPQNLNPRTREFAADLKRRFVSPERISSAALLHFREEPFSYTLQPPLLLDANMIDQFLFETRSGFCEHYAAAYAFIMRSAGVPARVVTGYQGGEINPVDGYLTVRQSDAHAWTEIWIEGKGWRRVDPTAYVAPSRIEQGINAALPENDPLPALVRLDSSWLRDMRNRWEAANNAWNQWILGYNPQRQRDVLSRIGLNEPDWKKMMMTLGVLCGIALSLVALWTLHQRKSATPGQQAWQRFCDRLARRGIRRFDWEGPLAFAERAGHAWPEIAALAHEAARCYAEIHYGAGKRDMLKQLERCSACLGAIKKPLKNVIFIGAIPSLLFVSGIPVMAETAPAEIAPPFIERPEVRAFIDEARARHDFEAAALRRCFSAIRSNAVVLEAISPAAPPEQKTFWPAYRQRFVNARKINEGLRFLEKHGASLSRAHTAYGVPPAIIVAIVGVETGYGKNAGKFTALEALATLAFDYPPRAAYFKDELLQLLLLAREHGNDPLGYKSSYAGAIGIPQFMPGSYRRYAVDFDGDGKIDLRGNPVDAIGSVAHFLFRHGWKDGETVALPVTVKENPEPLLAAGILPSLPPQALERHGVQIAENAPPPPSQADAALIALPVGQDTPPEYWVGFGNFYVITRYNRSTFYAMSVFQLSEALRAAAEKSASAGKAPDSKRRPAQRHNLATAAAAK